jgi:hypothetical protein
MIYKIIVMNYTLLYICLRLTVEDILVNFGM